MLHVLRHIPPRQYQAKRTYARRVGRRRWGWVFWDLQNLRHSLTTATSIISEPSSSFIPWGSRGSLQVYIEPSSLMKHTHTHTRLSTILVYSALHLMFFVCICVFFGVESIYLSPDPLSLPDNPHMAPRRQPWLSLSQDFVSWPSIEMVQAIPCQSGMLAPRAPRWAGAESSLPLRRSSCADPCGHTSRCLTFQTILLHTSSHHGLAHGLGDHTSETTVSTFGEPWPPFRPRIG